MQTRRPAVNLSQVADEIAAMLRHHRALESLARRQDAAGRGVADQLQRRQNEAELQRRVRDLHPADLASVLESLRPTIAASSGPHWMASKRRKRWSSSRRPPGPG